jgi:magnesium-transporting ATPase (P-type)
LHVFYFFNFFSKVIVEKDNQIYLYCKGGDTKIKERLANSETDMINQTDEHLNVKFNYLSN